MKGYLKTGIAVLAFLLMTMGAASAQTVSVDNVSLQVGDTGTVNVVLDQVPSDGLSFANVSVDISNSSVAEFTDVSFPSWATTNQNSTFPSSTMWFKVGDLGGNVQAGNTNVVLATLTVKGLAEGSASTDVTLNDVQADDTYQQIKDQFSTSSGSVTVTTAQPTTTPTEEQGVKRDVYVLFKHNEVNYVQLKFKDVTDNTGMTPSFINVTYGNTFDIKANSFINNSVDNIDVLIYRGNSLFKSYKSLEEGEEISVDTDSLNMKPAHYTFVVKAKDTDDNVIASMDSRDGETNYGVFKLSIDPSVYGKPVIEVNVQNRDNKVTIGDQIYLKVSVWGSNEFDWKMTRYEDNPLKGVTYDSVRAGTSNYISDYDLKINTYELFNSKETGDVASTGTHQIRFTAGNTIYDVNINIEKPAVTLNMDTDKATPGMEITAYGITNLAETDEDSDVNGSNYVLLLMFNSTDVGKADIDYNANLKSFTISGDTLGSWSDFISGTPNKTTEAKYGIKDWKLVEVRDDGSFEKEHWKLPTEISDDEYTDWQIIAIPTTVTHDDTLAKASHELKDEDNTITDYLLEKDVDSFEMKEPEVKLNPVDSVGRGEDFTISGETNLPEGAYIYVFFEDANTLSNEIPGTPSDSYKYIREQVDANGNFKTDEFKVKSNADLTTYKIYAVYTELEQKPNPVSTKTNWVSHDSINLRVVKQKLNATLLPEDRTVAKGDEITIKGTTGVDYVYVYASDHDVLKDVTEVRDSPIEVSPDDMKITASDDKFSKDIDVLTDADTGTYTIYVYAPANPDEINKVEDAQAIFNLVVTEATIQTVTVDDTTVPTGEAIQMVAGASPSVDVDIGTDQLDDIAYLDYTFKGEGLKAETSSSNYLTPSDGVFEFDIKPFIEDATDEFKSTYNATQDYDLIKAGTYSLKLELSTGDNYNTADKVDEQTYMVTVSNPQYEVTLPSEVAKGDTLKVTIDSNRKDVYDELYVFVKTPADVYTQKVSTDENGTAVAEFETYDFPYGTVGVYVRDTMGTFTTAKTGLQNGDFSNKDVAKTYYDLDPATTTARQIDADDDIVITKQVSIVKAGAVTTPTTPPTTETPTPPPTTETPTPPPTTETPTPPTTETPTPPPATPTPTPKPSPGFELIFAVAGLLAVAYLLRRR